MHLISSRLYGIFNYLSGIFIFGNPWLFDFENYSSLTWIFQAMGATMIICNVFTNYETGIIKLIPIRGRLIPDTFIAVFLSLTPWVFDFYNIIFLPQLLIGILMLVAAAFVDPVPSYIKSSYPHL